MRWLTRYGDAIRTPITVIFDGAGAVGPRSADARSAPEMEVLYSGPGQTADQLIERVAHRLTAFGDVLVVTDDHAERDTITSMGGMASSCDNFVATIKSVLKGWEVDLERYNQRELNRFRSANKS